MLIKNIQKKTGAENTESIEVDFCVVGGGLAGICAAIAAARRGLRVALVQNRSVLGGNASSEIRQSIGGAAFSGHYPDAREGGLIDELRSALRTKSVDGSLNDYAESSIVFLTLCLREPNLRLFLNTQIDEVDVREGSLHSVAGLQSSTGMRFRFEATQFADCSGDAVLAYLAGCDYLTGQEAASQFGETLAPPVATTNTMGNTILFQTEELPTPFIEERPDWVPDLSQIECYWTLHPPKAPMKHGSWLFEYGGELDTIRDAEKIHLELIKILYAAWFDLKSRPECGMANYRISFISALPGKRESRRIVGDHILTEGDVVETRRFKDDVAYAGWALDLHPPTGFYGKQRPTTFYFFPEVHSIPLRSLYAKDLKNLWMAGRNISTTHVALGGLRLMATCGLMGECIGIAASVAQTTGAVSCKETGESHISEIQEEILRGGGFIPGVAAKDPYDLAPLAKITASGVTCLANEVIEDYDKIGTGLGFAFPVTAGHLSSLTLRVRASKPCRIEAALRPIRHRRDFHSDQILSSAFCDLTLGEGSAVLSFSKQDLPEDLVMVHLHCDDPELEIAYSRERVTGVHVADHATGAEPDVWSKQLGMPNPAKWMRRFNTQRVESPKLFHKTPVFQLAPDQLPYKAPNVVNGVNRAERLPNLWMAPMQKEAWIQFDWEVPQPAREVRMVFDADMDLALPAKQPTDTLVHSYRLEGTTSGGSKVMIADVSGNSARLVRHEIPVLPDDGLVSLRVTVTRMHGDAPTARIFEIRVLDRILP